MTLEYVFVKQKGKHFLTFLLFAIMPALVLSYIFPPSHYIAIFANYNTPNFANFGRLWLPLFDHPIWTLVIFVCGLLMLVFAIAAINSIIMRHFRVNDFSLPQLFISTDENFFPSFAIALTAIILALLLHTFNCLFILLWYSLRSSVLGLTLSITSVLLLLITGLYMWASLTMWLPIMSFNGIPVFKALQLSFAKSQNYHKKMFLTNFTIASFGLIFTIAAWLCRSITPIRILLDACVYIMYITLSIPATFITYCDVEGIKREDLIQSPYKRR